MSRIARVVVPGYPHLIVQPGNARQKTFCTDADYAFYLKLLREAFTAEQAQCLGYVLMPNHVHVILVPPAKDSDTRDLQMEALRQS
jgi:putative transposase